MGETLTADTTDIADADGLSGATFIYRWTRNDGSTDTSIQGATGSSYTLSEADEGQTVKVERGDDFSGGAAGSGADTSVSLTFQTTGNGFYYLAVGSNPGDRTGLYSFYVKQTGSNNVNVRQPTTPRPADPASPVSPEPARS